MVQSDPLPVFTPKSRIEDEDPTKSKSYLNSNEIKPNIATLAADLNIPLSATSSLTTEIDNCEILVPQMIPLDPKKIISETVTIPNVMRTIKLSDTHIFTPIKGTNSISQEVTDHNPPLEAMNDIAFKEYHDVEYNLAKPKNDDILSNYFVGTNENYNLNVLEPQKVGEINWSVDESPVNNHFVINQANSGHDEKVKPNLLSPVLKPKQKENFSKPVFGTSPTEGTKNCDEFDEDFSDFQAAPLPVQSLSQFSNSNELSAGVKGNQVNDFKTAASSAWNDSLIDAKEIARIEAAFPKCKVVNEKREKEGEDDEWSEFVSPPTIEQTKSVGKEKEREREREKESTVNNNDDDWSDFVAMPPPKLTNHRDFSLSSQISSGPRFLSWNQPSLPPQQYFNKANSGNNNFLTLANNFGFSSTDATNNQQRTNQQHQSQSRNPNISLIPELNFSMPKNIINLPYNNFGNLSKK